MAKFNRRKLLISGMTASVSASTVASLHAVFAQSVQAQSDLKTQTSDETIEALFGSDGDGSSP